MKIKMLLRIELLNCQKVSWPFISEDLYILSWLITDSAYTSEGAPLKGYLETM